MFSMNLISDWHRKGGGGVMMSSIPFSVHFVSRVSISFKLVILTVCRSTHLDLFRAYLRFTFGTGSDP